MLKEVLVLGSGSAGLLMALGLKRSMPEVKVCIVRSPEIGVVGVGESTTPNVPNFLFNFLGVSPRVFYQLAEPTWKLGIHFLWGPRPKYEYPFTKQLDVRISQLPRPNGYYLDQDFAYGNLACALMTHQKAFTRRPDGSPDMEDGYAFHLENAKLVKALEYLATNLGIEFIDATLRGVEKDGQTVTAIVLEDGRKLSADFFIDASGFRSELLGKALEEPFVSFDKSLFNDRAILGSWERGEDEPILPYTTAETMESGWSWRIDHEPVINRGYVFCSRHISEEDARKEFALKNPRAKINDRLIKFRTGRYQRDWVGNVMAIGNACGFVEPLEATSLMMICWQCQTFLEMVKFVGPTPGVRDLYNKVWSVAWEEVRDFLVLHFKTNTRLNTPYWQSCREDCDASSINELLEFYAENGPTGFCRYKLSSQESQFGIEGYLVQLVGNRVPYHNKHAALPAEQQLIDSLQGQYRTAAKNGLSVKEALGIIRHPNWRWAVEQMPARAVLTQP